MREDHLDLEGLAHLTRWVQDGVVSRRQLAGLGFADHDVRRWVRRRTLTPLHRGVYLDHTGTPTWEQRAWAAVLVHAPAALTLRSALPDPPRRGPVHVAIDQHRTVTPVAGVVAHRTSRLTERVHPRTAPPRLRLEEAAVEVAAGTDAWTAFTCFARACHTRETDAARIAAALRRRGRVPGRALLLDMLDDLAAGSCSVLEREYLARVVRPHGLPVGDRQAREQTTGGTVLRDVDLPAYGLVVELDGRAFHDTPAARDRDLDRDLEAMVRGGRTTLRLGWGQVLGRPCRTAGRVAQVLHARGWDGPLRACPQCLQPPQ